MAESPKARRLGVQVALPAYYSVTVIRSSSTTYSSDAFESGELAHDFGLVRLAMHRLADDPVGGLGETRLSTWRLNGLSESLTSFGSFAGVTPIPKNLKSLGESLILVQARPRAGSAQNIRQNAPNEFVVEIVLWLIDDERCCF